MDKSKHYVKYGRPLNFIYYKGSGHINLSFGRTTSALSQHKIEGFFSYIYVKSNFILKLGYIFNYNTRLLLSFFGLSILKDRLVVDKKSTLSNDNDH